MRALKPLTVPAYRRLAVALVLGTFALGLWVVAQVWEVIRIGGQETDLSLVAAAGAVGTLLPALLAGVAADRVPQKLILIAVATTETAAIASVALLSATDLTQLWHLAVAAFVAGVAMSFYYPAYSAWLPALVPESMLLAVNGIEGMVRPLVHMAIGPAVAGAVVAAASPGAALTLAAASSAGGVLVLTTVPLTPVRRDFAAEGPTRHPVAAAVHDMVEGFRYMVRTPWLLATLLFASLMVLAVIGPMEVLLPFLIKDRLGGDANQHAWALAGFGLGGAAGSLLMASLTMPRRYLTVMNVGWGIGALPFVLIGMANHIWVVVVSAFAVGVLFHAPMVIWGTLLQRRVPPRLLGRVASLDFFVSLSLMPVSMALAGPVADAIGLRTTFLIAGVVPVVAAVVAVVVWRLPADELANPLRDEEPVTSAGGGQTAAVVAAEEPE